MSVPVTTATGRFRNRAEAGAYLAGQLRSYAGRPDLLVLGIPRGGVPVAFEVARTLHAPLDIVVVRKLGLPKQPELAIGAIASGGIRILNEEVVTELRVPKPVIEAVTRRERRELERRERTFRGEKNAVDPRGRTVILVDDGLATGATMRAAIAAVRQGHAGRLVVAVPVAQSEVFQAIKALVDDMVCPIVSVDFFAVGQWYVDFSPTSDDDVRELFQRAASPAPAAANRFSELPPENQMAPVQKSELEKDLRPDHHEQTRGQRSRG
jgi:putative phosphoribosyl transferase